MVKYADYDFYEKEYMGELSIDLFNIFIVKASKIIDRNVNKPITQEVIDNLSEADKENLKYVACELVDYLEENPSTGSISIDGVSINKSSTNKSKEEILNGLPIDLIRYL